MPAHRDEFFDCPACKVAMQPKGPELECSSCEGLLVPNQLLEAMLDEMSPDDRRPLEQRLLAGSAIPRRCPRCVTDMTPHTMYGITIDRCAEHGVWFDGKELGSVLHADGQAFGLREAVGTPHGPLHTLLSPFLRRKILERHIAKTSPKKKKEP